MLNRSDTLKRLNTIADMSDQEIAMNAAWIREVASSAHSHIIMLRTDREKVKRQVKAQPKRSTEY